MNAPALEGDLAHFRPSEVLQFLRLLAATGRLELERPGECVRIDLEGGRPLLARSTARSVRIGEALVHRGALSGPALARALDEQSRRPATRLGLVIADSGLATREQVTLAIQEVVRRILFGVMLWPGGRFRFLAAEPERAAAVTVEVELDRIILDGLREADEQIAAS